MISMIIALGLAGARLWALLFVQASWRRAIGVGWTWIAGALALSLAGVALLRGQLPLQVVWQPSALAVALLLELLLGAVIGLLVSLPGWALVGATDESAQGLGLGEQPSALASMLLAASLAAGLGLGLHRPLCAGLLGLFDRFVLGEAWTWTWTGTGASLGAGVVADAVALTSSSLALATPVLLTRVLAGLCIGSLARTGFAAQSLMAVLGPGLRLGAGLLALGAAWSTYPEAFARGLGGHL